MESSKGVYNPRRSYVTVQSQDVVFQDRVFGEQGAEPLMDSFDSYIVVSVLTATASFAALFEFEEENSNSLMHNLAVLLCSLCTASGIYATVVFSYSSAYGRSAVGTGRIHIYETFLDDTMALRKKAFNAYQASLYTFMILLIVAAGGRVQERLNLPFMTLLLGLSALSFKDWNTILIAARPIFAEEKSQKELKRKLRESEQRSDVILNVDDEPTIRSSLLKM